MDGLSIFALILLIVVILTISYGMIIIHDIPYHLAVKRNHPHQDAIHVGGWISLFTLHAIWPFLWIWATLYRPERGYGFGAANGPDGGNDLAKRLEALEARLALLEPGSAPAADAPAATADANGKESDTPGTKA
jgi:hypothetical protein